MTKANAHEWEQAKRMYQYSKTLSQCVGKWVPLVPNGFPICRIGILECFNSLGQKMQIVNNIPTGLSLNFVKVLKCRYWKCVAFSIWRFETQVVNKKKVWNQLGNLVPNHYLIQKTWIKRPLIEMLVCYWKVLSKDYNFVVEIFSIETHMQELWTCKVTRSIIWQIWEFLGFLGSLESFYHFDVALIVNYKIS